MGTFENQEYLSHFIVENSTSLASISQDNPELFNAISNAFDFLSQRFGTGETKAVKVELPKTKPKKKTKIAPTKVFAKDLIQLGQSFVDSTVPNGVVWKIFKIDDIYETVSVKWFDKDGNLMTWNYGTNDVINSITRKEWIPVLEDGTPMNVEIIEPPVQAPAVQPMKPPAPDTDVEIDMDVSGRLGIDLTEDEVFKIGNKFYNTQRRIIFTLSEIDGSSLDFDFRNLDGDIETYSMPKDRVKELLNKTWFLLTEDKLPLEVRLKTKPKRATKSVADKIADLELQLETAQLLAEVGDTDAIADVQSLTKKIETLKKKQ